ncbi:hypothetical protein PLESTB_001529000 [Pleodorina starrii]|uniref:Uncharacterized protein n=1 Tax=Pleodorina starrii TaxID=330485 RepID=A0A9W6F8J2_9CHLO|nr:hypothetical protein PLESTB_001529000 [Pleodorina starrii]GLC75333.1 hypothetical protein PLESTF_001624900 [Pleodorina starrii]
MRPLQQLAQQQQQGPGQDACGTGDGAAVPQGRRFAAITAGWAALAPGGVDRRLEAALNPACDIGGHATGPWSQQQTLDQAELLPEV